MANPTEIDLFQRSLGGDRRARTELYKKYIFSNSRIRELGAGYSSVNDFLHDCLNNLLRTGHSWDTESSLVAWVESVAIWTALISERQKDMHSRGAQGEIRMCAEFEGEDASQREVMTAYAPPAATPDDSPLSRMLSLLNDSEKVVFEKRVVGNADWEQIANEAEKPLSATGAIFARVVAKLVRLFGAPPPADDDLVPVVSRSFANPLKPEGRAISLQLDNAFYALTPELQSIGVKTVEEARAVMLWETARRAAPPADNLRQHLSRCRYCAAMLRSMLLMQQAVASAPGTAFRVCPGAFTLANAPDMVHEAFDQHLALCTICRGERTQVLEGNVPGNEAAEIQKKAAAAKQKIAWGTAALVVGALSVGGYLYFVQGRSATDSVLVNEKDVPTVLVDTRYQDLVQDVPADTERILASVLPQNQPVIRRALNELSLNDGVGALATSEPVARKGNDPGAQMMYAMSLYRTQLLTDAYREMLKSEAMPPRNPLRCWVMLQFSLAIGDRKTVEREAQHLAGDPEYGKRATAILAAVRARN